MLNMATSDDLETSSDFIMDKVDLDETESFIEETTELQKHIENIKVEERKENENEILNGVIAQKEATFVDNCKSTDTKEITQDSQILLKVESDGDYEVQNVIEEEFKETTKDSNDLSKVDSVTDYEEQNVIHIDSKKKTKDLQSLSNVESTRDYEDQNVIEEECKETTTDSKDLLNVDSVAEYDEQNVIDTECKQKSKEQKGFSGSEYEEQNVTDAVYEEMIGDIQDLPNVESGSKYVKYAGIRKMVSSFCRMETRVMSLGLSQESVKGESQTKIKQNEDPNENDMKDLEEVENVVHNFSSSIGLGNFYPEKLQLSDVMKVVSKSPDVHLTELGVYFVRNLVMLNFLSRDKMIQDFLREISGPSESDMEQENIDFLDDLLGNGIEDTNLNPLDVIHCVFKCSSLILQQVVASRLFMCQLAVPLILPSSVGDQCKVSMWPLRSINIESKTNNGVTNDNAVTCPCHVVSFVRMGRPALSKSKLMNEIINDRYHSSFLNKDCPLGTAQREISDGLVETSWYLPSNTLPILTNVTMFLNLRGNGLIFQDQMNLLLQISDIIVVILDVECLTDDSTIKKILAIQQSNLQILLAFDTKHHKKHLVKSYLRRFHNASRESKGKTELYVLSRDNQDKSTAIIKEEMRPLLKNLLKSKPVESFFNRVTQSNIITDEDKTIFRITRQNAEELLNQIKDTNLVKKDQIVPLQGKLWCSLSKNVKEVNKSSLNLTLQEQGQIRYKMLQYRIDQAKICKNLGKFMQTFLFRLTDTQIDTSLFVTWLKFFLDERSRKLIPEVLLKYQSDWLNLMAVQEKEHIDQNTKQLLRKVLNESELNLAEASFGFEHLCREMGQIFESLDNSNFGRADLIEIKRDLTEIAADLILLGQPFEIMDGDAGNVPILWVKAVLERLKERLGDKRLLALSVLGIQSSGKSTLLNAMFGLQFAVSAGRCTRGVFMQMAVVEDEKLPFDYVLVIDTEGLRAPELANEKYSHDNELATFVIGLGDITIVNIKGENTAEIKDVLQIAVHAFLRLMLANKSLNLKQKCVFVHQNVPALDAYDKMMHGRRKFIETLDAMTKEAADQENIAEIQFFNQVIEFDSEKCVWYFPDLWHGDPPMAPVNPGYSESVSMVKDVILYQLTKGRETYLTLSDTISRIEDLWDGILKDDFVFSFRNSLEFKAYANIEKKCEDLIWDIEKHVLEFHQSTAKTMLIDCQNENDLRLAIPEVNSKLNTEIQVLVSEKLTELDLFIESSSLKDVLIQWKQNKVNRIKSKAQDLITNAKDEINNTKEELRIKKKQVSEQRRHEMEINEKAKELALSMKGKTPSENDMREKFEKMWTVWLTDFNHQDIKDIEDNRKDIEHKIKNHVFERSTSLNTFLNDDWRKCKINFRKLKKLEGSFPIELITENCIEIHTFLKFLKRESKTVCQKQALEITNMILRNIDTKLQGYRMVDNRFDISYVNDILRVIDEKVIEHNTKNNKEFKFNLLPPYHSRLTCYVAGFASIFFTDLQEAYNKKHSPEAQMEAYKDTVWTLFENTVNNRTEEVIAMGFFKTAIIEEIKTYVDQILPIDTQERIWSEFSNGKYSFIKEMLKDKQVMNSFDKIKFYIHDSEGFAEAWLKHYVDNILFKVQMPQESSFYCELARKRINKIFSCLNDGVCKATKTAHSNIQDWIAILVEHIRNSVELPLPRDALVHVEQRNVKDSNSFGLLITGELKDMEKSLLDQFSLVTAANIRWTVNPVSSIMTKLWGCTAKCMFCKEPCMNTEASHVGYPHKCLQHRPTGVIGFRWIDSRKLMADFCNHLVNSNSLYRFEDTEQFRPYRKYTEEFPDWEIAPNSDVSKYWIWIFCRYKDDFMKLYNVEEPDIPNNWHFISLDEALKSL